MGVAGVCGWYGSASEFLLVTIYLYCDLFGLRFHSNSMTENHFMALKVLTVNLTAAIVDYKCWEIESASLVAETNPKHPGYQHCVVLREYFICESYHGPHFALAFDDVQGSDVQSLQRTQPNKVFSSHVTKRIIKQVLLALDYLHRECHLVHTGKHVKTNLFPNEAYNLFQT